jgi:aquaporin Z
MKIIILPYLSELLGTFLLVLALLMSDANPLVTGGSLILIMSLSSKAGGIHVNPAISIMAFLNGKLDSYKTIGFVAAQIAGAILSLYVVKNFA